MEREKVLRRVHNGMDAPPGRSFELSPEAPIHDAGDCRGSPRHARTLFEILEPLTDRDPRFSRWQKLQASQIMQDLCLTFLLEARFGRDSTNEGLKHLNLESFAATFSRIYSDTVPSFQGIPSFVFSLDNAKHLMLETQQMIGASGAEGYYT